MKAKRSGYQEKISSPHNIPIYTCPPDMTLEEWQIALRKQIAAKKQFDIRPLQSEEQVFGDYIVKSTSKIAQDYKVAFRGENSNWNYCSCPDFKTNHLGTCKHIEAVQLFLKNSGRQLTGSFEGEYTSVYVSYSGSPSVRIRIGTEKKAAFQKLAAKYFSQDFVLLQDSYSKFEIFLHEAYGLSKEFHCYDDAIAMVVEERQRQYRQEVIQQKYADGRVDKLLKTDLYPYQHEGILFATKAGRCIIADEMGLGKTIQAIGAAELIKKEFGLSSVLIVCPTSLKYQWKKEIYRFTGCEAHVIEGNHLSRKKQYDNSDAFYKIVSYQSVCNDIKILGSLWTDLVIMDEAQRLKNWDTQLSQAAKHLQSDYMLVLTGTPLENKLEELYNLTQYANPFSLGPYYKFRAETCIVNEAGKVIGYQNLNKAGEKLKNILIRRRKLDVNLQLPERMDKTVFVAMTKEQKEIHDEFNVSVASLVHKWQKHSFLSENDRQRLLIMLNQMRMVCDSTYILDQSSRFDTKIEELMNILENIFESGSEKVLVFSQWERMTRLVAQELDRRNIKYENLHGGIPSKKRKDLVDNFTENPDCRVFLSTDAGGTGLNLQAASYVINLDLPWNPAVLEQRIGRIHRIGQKRNIQVINLVSADSIEEKILSKLEFKTSLFEGILDNGSDSVFMASSKFDKLMSSVAAFVQPDDQGAESSSVDVADMESVASKTKAAEQSSEAFFEEEGHEEGFALIKADDEAEYTAVDSIQKKAPRTDAVDNQGLQLFAALSHLLSSPEKTSEFVSSIVEEDASGNAMLKIPVPSKESVVQLFAAVGKVLEQSLGNFENKGRS